jgi:predicted phage terminase large subunit-like protein
MNTDKTEAYFALVRTDFKHFVMHAFAMLNPSTPFLDNWHIDAIVHCLNQAMAGQRRRLNINLAPRHLKSFIVSVAFPAFVLGRDPTAKFICVSYSDELSRALSRDFKRLVESAWFQALFSRVKLVKTAENEVTTTEGGFRYATSVGGTITGRGADFIIIDDPIKPDDATSAKALKDINEWFGSTLHSRLDDKQRGVLILVMQRVHVNDLSGYLSGIDGFHKLSLPAVARQDEEIAIGPGQTYKRLKCEALHPARESREQLLQTRQLVGPTIFNAQYQQAPEAPDGQIFKRKYFKLVDKAPALKCGKVMVSIDSALSTSATADFSAISLVLAVSGKLYVLSAERGRSDYDALKAKAWTYVEQFGAPRKPVHFLVESAGSGIALITDLRKAIGRGEGRLQCHEYRPREAKVTRAMRTLPFFEEGRVVIVNERGRNEWVEPFLNEFLCFPHGRFDDQVDTLVQLLYFRRMLALAEVPLF